MFSTMHCSTAMYSTNFEQPLIWSKYLVARLARLNLLVLASMYFIYSLFKSLVDHDLAHNILVILCRLKYLMILFTLKYFMDFIQIINILSDSLTCYCLVYSLGAVSLSHCSYDDNNTDYRKLEFADYGK